MHDNSFIEAVPFIIFIVALYGGLGLLALVNYILRGLGILRLSESRGLQNGWLGFIPYAAEYQLGKISGEIKLGKRTMKRPGLWMALVPAVSYTVFFSFYFSFIFSIIRMSSGPFNNYHYEPNPAMIFTPMILLVFVCIIFSAAMTFICIIQGMVYHRIFSCYSDGQLPVFYTLLALFVPLAAPILMFHFGGRQMTHPPEYMQNYQRPYAGGAQYYHPYPYNQPPVQHPYPQQPPAPPQRETVQYPPVYPDAHKPLFSPETPEPAPEIKAPIEKTDEPVSQEQNQDNPPEV